MANLQLVPAGKNVEAQYVEMMVPLYSYGCEKKIKRALANLKGIYSVNVDYDQQKVTVWGICDKHDVLTIVKSKRKGARFWNSNDEANRLHQESHSAPSSPKPSLIRKSSARYLTMIKRQSLKLDLSMVKRKSLNWQILKKVFVRSYSF
ncbi:heavy metal transport/detoxification superfamily protein [Striga asiatica]|uniref:Heavy metal transport/detoxification superfamily protein n=1 Tax=Striga asiatica TaxID=4170 RepID=A0A5A7PKN6_STRAF|nr:heavy metal transport/detoxification superfamily protein [Striga asiatica]